MKKLTDTRAIRVGLLWVLLLVPLLCSPSRSQAAPGDLVWTNQLDASGGTDRALAVAARGKSAFAAGRVTNASGNLDWVVTGYDAVTGSVLWQDQLDVSGGRDEAFAVIVAGKIVAAAGRVRSATSNDNWHVSAYDSKTGGVLWEDQYDQAADNDRANALAVSGKTIIAAGRVTNAAGDEDWFVRAYDAATGSVLWHDQYDVAAGDDEAVAVAGRGSKVFVVGHVTNGAGDEDWFVRAYDVKTGAILWSDELDVVAGDDAALNVAIRGSSVFVAGYVVNGSGNEDWKVRVYDAGSGAVLWEDQYDLANDDDRAVNLTVKGGTLVAVGNARNLAGDTDFVVRTYDTGSGNLLWQDRYNPTGGNDAAFAAAITSGGVLTVGRVTNANGDFDWFVRAYAPQSGAVLWTDQYDQSSDDDQAVALTAAGSRAFVAGDSANAAGNADWLVRTFSVK